METLTLIVSGVVVGGYVAAGSLWRRESAEKSLLRSVPESEVERLQLFRRFFPTTMAKLDQPLDQLTIKTLQTGDGATLMVQAWIAQDNLMSVDFAEDELRLRESLEGEVLHYVLEQLGTKLGLGVPQSDEERIRLFRRFYPRTMLKLDLDQPLDEPTQELLRRGEDGELLELKVDEWVIDDNMARLVRADEEERRQAQALEGEVKHYAFEQLKKRLMKPSTDAEALPKEDSATPEQEKWLKERFPRAWEFVSNINVITSERDFNELHDSLIKLFTAGTMKDTWGERTKNLDPFDIAQAEHIAIAMLYNKKKIPPKKHWWS